nr:MAG TPA: hypothetical protein [Caudoviricetes sp.]
MYYDIMLLSSKSIIGTATGSSYIPIICYYLYDYPILGIYVTLASGYLFCNYQV